MKRFFTIFILVAAASCIDPYYPNLKDYKSLLVVEGLITNENSSYKIKLCRTISREDSAPEKVTDANIYITDGDGIKTHLQNCGGGNYKTDSTSFTGVIGQKYTLQILTSDGKEYKSEECTMFPVAGIDSVYYEKGEEISGSLGESLKGIKIYLNSGSATGMNQFFRWTFEETWKFFLDSPPRYQCIIIGDTALSFEEVPVVKETCWKNNKSGEIVINSILPGGVNYIDKQEIQFIAPIKSDRLTQQYSILVKQYSVSEKEYDFWSNLKKVSESGGDIFDSQPYQVISNIHNINDASEMVLGYFEVSAVSRKRIFITAHELDTLYLPHYQTDCVEYVKSPSDYPPGGLMSRPPTWLEIYTGYMFSGDFTFVGPILDSEGALLKLIFAPNVCSVCELTGVSVKPDFWIDLE
jgi:Domain of unknown function (DUF4249)